MKRQKGFTFIEVIVVVMILVMLAILAMAAFRPKFMVDRAHDSRRKKDVARIQAAFEEYANDDDNGCYPNQAVINELMDPQSCRQNVDAFPQLKPWVCDPQNQPYKLAVPPDDCPRWYRILTKLDNEHDTDIPENWFTDLGRNLGSSVFVYTPDQVNYGRSSPNINWHDPVSHIICETNCYKKGMDNSCSPVDLVGGETCSGSNCFRDNDCTPVCQVLYCP